MKKMMQFLKLSLALALVAGVLSCEKPNSDTFSVSESSFSLDPSGSDEKVITVTSKDKWEVNYGTSDWLIKKSIDETSFTVGAKPNLGEVSRKSEIIVKSGNEEIIVTVSQDKATINFERIPQYFRTVCSPSGVYIGSIEGGGVDAETQDFVPVVLNTSTGEVRKFAPINAVTLSADAVTDDGILFISNETMQGFLIDKNGEIQDLDRPATCVAARVSGVSRGGETWAGWATVEPGLGYKFVPVVWNNGIATQLPLPDTTIIGDELTFGGYARGCSDDGSIIYGTTAEQSAAIYWKNDKVNYLAKESIERIYVDGNIVPFVSKPGVSTQSTECSPNGKYIAFAYKKETPTEGGLAATTTTFAGYFNTETEEHYIYPEVGYMGATVSDNGDFSLGQLADDGILPMRGFILPAGGTELIRTSEWLNNTYSVSANKDEIIIHFSKEGNLFGFYLTDDLAAKQLLTWYLYLSTVQ